jgi:hypothetical protein
LCDISPPSNSIMNLAPYLGTSSKADVVDLHDQISNLCLSRVNTNNVHHPKPTYSKHYNSHSWKLIEPWFVKSTSYCCSKILNG